MAANDRKHRAILERLAHQAMLDRGLLPDFSAEVRAELEIIRQPAMTHDGALRDLRGLVWCSIDNDDSLDLDQISVAEEMPGGKTKILVGVADVAAMVYPGTAINEHARHNTTTVYTAAKIFSMLPEKLSTNLTSLNADEDRLAIVAEMVIGADGSILSEDIFRALVHNQAKLAYNGVADWLDGHAPIPAAAGAVKGLAENLRLQDQAAQRMKRLRHEQGALSLETIEARPVFEGDEIRALEREEKNRAREMIENLMIAANGVTARFPGLQALPADPAGGAFSQALGAHRRDCRRT